MPAIAAFFGRVMIALLFILSGIPKIIDPSGPAQMMQAAGLPGNLAMAVGIFEVVAGLLLALGVMTRLVSILLAGFVALTILFYHHDFGTQEGMTSFLLHLAILGGLLVVFAYGQMRWSYDHMRAARKGELAAADASTRVHEAELRAARAEGRADGAGLAVTDIDHDGRPEVRKRRWF
ncbi:DoxX family membrane protein [Altererythrobacter aerius]|uniref:DoxX family membrane protein n=1 Tax=Tsuneonella aeria TaxID=1837929 RepID=A0A6I4TDE2_9SPHN|nr:DoxX family protein [Tsuneonella aeria]MXO75252.1 DoxX family membrane protein [Tsuneonella aeria]